MNRHELYLGWDVGGTKSAAVVGTSAGEILDRVQWPSNTPAGPQAMLGDFLTHAGDLLKKHPRVAAVGVSIGGPMNARSGVIKSPPHLPGWDNIPLRDILHRKLRLPVFIEHDAAACLLAEWLWGAAAGKSHAVYITCGTGCGAGVLIANRILRGPDGQTPEVGHIRLAEDGPEMFGKAGCVESFCAGEGIAVLAGHMFPKRFTGPVSTKELHDLLKQGDRHAQAVLGESARRTGQLCALLVDVFSPQVILLGSLARYFGPWWVQGVRDECLRESLPANVRGTRIIPAKLGTRLQDLSAVAPCEFAKRQKS